MEELIAEIYGRADELGINLNDYVNDDEDLVALALAFLFNNLEDAIEEIEIETEEMETEEWNL